VKTELDSLATALYVKTDDLLKDSPHLAPWRPAVGIAPKLTDAELVTLAMTQAMLGFTSEARWLRHARSHLRNLFPHLPQQPGYNKRLRKAADLLWIVDSTPVECGPAVYRWARVYDCRQFSTWPGDGVTLRGRKGLPPRKVPRRRGRCCLRSCARIACRSPAG
jgi:hypothetical protein